MRRTPAPFDVVVPTVGRPSLVELVEALAAAKGPLPGRIILVDDRRRRDRPLLPTGAPAALAPLVEVLAGRGAGPAAARNDGWRAATAEWVAFLDDDVVPRPDWFERLAADLAEAAADVAGVQARLLVPLPRQRRPTDWERNVSGLATARWATADLAYRRRVLVEVGGFDERFPRAYREDADLGLRVVAAGWRIVTGQRRSTHPVRPVGRFTSVRLQAGNADDVLMDALHGPGWRADASAPAGRLRRHLFTTGAAVAAGAAALAGRPGMAKAAGGAWLGGSAELAIARIAPGPRTPGEVATMLATSVLLPPAATWHRVAGLVRRRRLLADSARAPEPAVASRPTSTVVGRGAARAPRHRRPDAVLLDRDGTLVLDVPYNGDPGRVVAAPGAREALDRLRAAGMALAVISNQSGVGRGLLTLEQVDAVNRRVEELLGPLGPWIVCPHDPGDGCECRKPAPGLVLQAAAALGVDPARCAVVGDIGADVEAARAAGARAVLVPTAATRPEEVEAAPEVAPDLGAAVDLLLGGDLSRRTDPLGEAS